MNEFKLNARCAVKTGLFAGNIGIIKRIEGERVFVEWELFQRKVEFDFSPDHLVVIEPAPPNAVADADDLYQLGDIVFMHDGMYHGNTATVTEVFPAVEISVVMPAHIPREYAASFAQITLVSPARRAPDDEYLQAIAAAVPLRGYVLRRICWWAQQAREANWSTPDDYQRLYADFMGFRRALDSEIAETIARAQARCRALFAPLSHAEKVARWQAEWQQWAGWRADMERVQHEVIAPALLSAEELAGSKETVDELVEQRMSAGRDLWERCQEE